MREHPLGVKGRDSMVLDVMEAVWPVVDGYVLDLFRARPLTKADIAADRRGMLRVLPPLTHRIAEAMPTWAQALGPVVEHVARILSASSPYEVSVPSVLTGHKHQAVARRRSDDPTIAAVRSRGPNPSGLAPRAKPRQRPLVASSSALPCRTCRGCGTALPVENERAATRRNWCDECFPDRRTELDERMRSASTLHAKHHRAATGVLPSHSDGAQARRQDANRRRQLARLAWEADHGGVSPDVEWYWEQLAPRLADLSLTEIAGALGVSTSSVSKFRRGLRVPSPRHWGVLADLIGPEAAGGDTATVAVT
ncbi:MAG TPA: helix-turn-helix transcriptional regulator [Acidimicrobiales bacterium]|nr:helix-turn-helix transcriptional regulator [Acidimicrobiales bacterium]